MRALLGLVAFLFSSVALSQPFVVTDPVVAGVTQCGVFLNSAPKVTIPVTSTPGGNICKYSVGSVNNGSHTIQMTAITVNDPVWGSQESAKSAPLSFVRPAPPATPAGLTLQP